MGPSKEPPPIKKFPAPEQQPPDESPLQQTPDESPPPQQQPSPWPSPTESPRQQQEPMESPTQRQQPLPQHSLPQRIFHALQDPPDWLIFYIGAFSAIAINVLFAIFSQRKNK